MKVLSPRNLFDLKQQLFKFNKYWGALLGDQPTTGVWIIYGKEKHGKTAFTLILAKYLAGLKKILYVSAEEGTDSLFIDSVRRAGITPADNIGFIPYAPLNKLNEKLKQRNAAKIVVIDNAVIYNGEFKRGGIEKLIEEHKHKRLLIILAHEERNEPFPTPAKHVKRMAKVIVNVIGLVAHVSGRCPGGRVIINDEKAELFGITFEKTTK